MSMTAAPTGSALGDYESLAAFGADASVHRTQIRPVTSPGLREVLLRFVEAFREPLAPLRGFFQRATAVDPAMSEPPDMPGGNWELRHISMVLDDDIPLRIVRVLEATPGWDATAILELNGVQASPASGADDVVGVIEEIARRIGIPVKDVLTAAGVKKSTYHSWKAAGISSPRLASQGRLWEVAQFVEDFTELLGVPIRHWLLADETRRKLFAMGRFAELHELLRSRPRSLVGAPEYASLAAIGGDTPISDSGTDFSRHPRGRVGGAQNLKVADRSRS